MTGYSRVFLDTTPLIYFLDNDMNFGEKARCILEEILLSGKTIVTSTITCTEYMVYPYRTHNQQKIDVFFDFVTDCGIAMIPINLEIAKKAAQIRAKYTSFRAMDALQLATAVCTGCDTFLTNDKQLRQFDEIKCVTVEAWPLTVL